MFKSRQCCACNTMRSVGEKAVLVFKITAEKGTLVMHFLQGRCDTVHSKLDCEQFLFLQILQWGEGGECARASSAEARAPAHEEKRETAPIARTNELCVTFTTQKYDWLMLEALVMIRAK